MNALTSPAGPDWNGLLQQGTGPVQQSFLDLVRNTRDYVGYHPDVVWGNLQTPQYAAAMLRLVIGFHEIPDDIEAVSPLEQREPSTSGRMTGPTTCCSGNRPC